ncbi:MAG: NAD(P)/FAD-dependent oxidoreductase [Kordiimonadaceae bacterium]|nr:NAD(P)/FAD-dependent oxidoreductase [Kordiimonadaceae bacterium]MBO6567410.1 NAD(P)/FAD-dependent oxidoreductase [Kordiimonadaceae bacterium]MBO6963376.1 NAD(P)/FAD-dependent oxidoreductase [Kordiimonadaceae bacterium]
MTIQKFDTIIIGGGNGGFGVSSVLAEAGHKIAFIEEREFGGVCPNRGCTPKKILVAAAQALDHIERATDHGITVGKATLDWAALIERKNGMIGFIPGAMKGVAEKRGTVFEGRAEFTGTNTVRVGEAELEADNIIIATGSVPRPLPIPGAEHLITSDEVLSDTVQPEEVVFIGGGVVALEFGHVYARAGSKVTILEVMPQLLPRMDSDLVGKLVEESERVGITIHTGVSVNEIVDLDGRVEVQFEKGGQAQKVTADRAVNGAGRVANTEGLNLEAAGINVDRGRINVTESLQSTENKAIWVVGDALVGAPQLSPVATYEGQIVGRNIRDGGSESPNYDALPSGVYAVPALATVGLTEAEAAEKFSNLKVTTNDMTGWFSGKSYNENVAWAKVLIDEDGDRVVGAHLIGHNADDLIHVFSLAMQHGIPASALQSSAYAYPSFSSDVKNLL